MNDILMEIFPEAVSNLIIRFNIHPVAEAFKRRIKIDEHEIQAVIHIYIYVHFLLHMFRISQ